MIKACGTAEFTADIQLENAVQVAVVRSTEHHAKIKSIDTAAAKKMPGVVAVITADDIKGTNRIRFVVPDQPVLCEDRVRYLGDPIVAVAAETLKQAEAAVAAVKVEYEPLPVMTTPEEALAPGAFQIHNHSPNLCFQQPLIKGDAAKAIAEAAAIVEAEFSTQWNHQAALEPEASVAYLEGEGKDATLVVDRAQYAIFTPTSAKLQRPSTGRTSATRKHTSAGSSGLRPQLLRRPSLPPSHSMSNALFAIFPAWQNRCS